MRASYIDLDIVQFSASTYFVEEAEEELQIDVIRLGHLKEHSTVLYKTSDASAKAGVKFTAAEGELSFAPGEWMQTVKIQITQDEIWSPTLEFKLILEHPRNCTIPEDLCECRVKIIDDDYFPSNKYSQFVPNCIEEISQTGLFFEFFKLNFGNPEIRWRTILILIIDPLVNLYSLLKLNAKAYLINVVLADDLEATAKQLLVPNRGTTAMIIGLAFVVPMFLLHIWDYAKIKLDVEGYTRVYVQTSMFRKYMNYSFDSRAKVRPAHMTDAILMKTQDLATAYTSVLSMAQLIFQLFIAVYFILMHDPDSWWILVMMPALMSVFAFFRSDALSKASEYAGPLKKELIEVSNQTCEHYRFIADFQQRSQMNELFERRAEEWRACIIPEAVVELNNSYFPTWLGPIFICIYIIVTAPMVFEYKTVSVGVFLTTMGVFGDVSSQFSDIYKLVMAVSTRIDSLKVMTKYFNYPTETLDCKQNFKRNRELMLEAHTEVMKKPPPSWGHLRTDIIPIQMKDVAFQFNSGTPERRPNVLFKNVTLSIPQGNLVAVVGPRAAGKSQLLRLLTRTVFQTSGDILIPTHLRVLYVGKEPVILDRTLWENLIFGRPKLQDRELVTHVLKELRMDQTLELLEAEFVNHHQFGIVPSSHGAVINSRNRLPSRSSDCRQVHHGRGNSNGTNYIALVEGDEDSEEFDDDDEEDTVLLKNCGCHMDDPPHVVINKDFSWQDELSSTEKSLITLARGLIRNPEVLVLHSPLHMFNDEVRENVLRVIRLQTGNRGLGLSEDTIHQRRPRTVIFTPETVAQARRADIIVQVDPTEKEVYVIDANNLREGFVPPTQGYLSWRSPRR